MYDVLLEVTFGRFSIPVYPCGLIKFGLLERAGSMHDRKRRFQPSKDISVANVACRIA